MIPAGRVPFRGWSDATELFPSQSAGRRGRRLESLSGLLSTRAAARLRASRELYQLRRQLSTPVPKWVSAQPPPAANTGEGDPKIAGRTTEPFQPATIVHPANRPDPWMLPDGLRRPARASRNSSPGSDTSLPGKQMLNQEPDDDQHQVHFRRSPECGWRGLLLFSFSLIQVRTRQC
jgi:hypothetical protein